MSNNLTTEETRTVEKELQDIEKKIEELRKRRIDLNSKLASMNVKDYAMKDRDGNEVKLSEMFGDKNFLILVHNMGRACSYCTMWADGFKDTYREIEKKAPFVLVCPDSPEDHKKFAESRDWGFKSYSAAGTDFIYDMGYEIRDNEKKSYWPGVSVFEKIKEGTIRRVSKDVFGPGDFYCNIWHFIDLLPNENVTMES